MKHITINAIRELCLIEKIEAAIPEDKWRNIKRLSENEHKSGPWACGALVVVKDVNYGSYFKVGFTAEIAHLFPRTVKVTCPECIKVMKEFGL